MSPDIIATIITNLGAFILVYLSVVKERYVSKNAIRREQLDKFYIPFYKTYCRGFLSQMKLSEMSVESRSIILDLMSENLHLMEPLSQSLYSEYYAAYLDMLEASDGNPMFPIDSTSQKFDDVFYRLTSAIFTEYSALLRKVKLPVPILPTPYKGDL
ncbi:MAG: hypothetical protein KHX30_02350 [Clostridium sp.]|nr:hypothetical protein [Clostridium sp.]